MIRRRFWRLKKGQIFRHKDWGSLLRKHGFMDFTLANDDKARWVYSIWPWTCIECEPPVDNAVTRAGEGLRPFVEAMDEAKKRWSEIDRKMTEELSTLPHDSRFDVDISSTPFNKRIAIAQEWISSHEASHLNYIQLRKEVARRFGKDVDEEFGKHKPLT